MHKRQEALLHGAHSVKAICRFWFGTEQFACLSARRVPPCISLYSSHTSPLITAPFGNVTASVDRGHVSTLHEPSPLAVDGRLVRHGGEGNLDVSTGGDSGARDVADLRAFVQLVVQFPRPQAD